jgi:pimeloyl-ACP methyl ester carboxylesterase
VNQSPDKPSRPRRVETLRGIAKLAVQGTTGVSRVAEGVTQSVWSTLGVPGGTTPGTTRGITGLVYRSVNGAARLVGQGVDRALVQVDALLGEGGAARDETPARAAVLAALNGVMGDRLAADGNPLATAMSLRVQGQAKGKVLLLVHGLCMNDLQWPDDYPAALAAAGYTPVFLRYNTGLAIDHNGSELSMQLDDLLRNWPVPVQELAILAHSMGGLVVRSACARAKGRGGAWLGYLRHIVFLGTPHHGAPLEKAGHWIEMLLGKTPWSAPFARLAGLRSAGITELRHGASTPLPEGVQCHTVAATTAGRRSLLADRLVGDGLVPLRSALGEELGFGKASRFIAYRTHHMQLLGQSNITHKILEWLYTEPLG